jgi:hypothetical protein
MAARKVPVPKLALSKTRQPRLSASQSTSSMSTWWTIYGWYGADAAG